jgi:hypothetical protein
MSGNRSQDTDTWHWPRVSDLLVCCWLLFDCLAGSVLVLAELEAIPTMKTKKKIDGSSARDAPRFAGSTLACSGEGLPKIAGEQARRPADSRIRCMTTTADIPNFEYSTSASIQCTQPTK